MGIVAASVRVSRPTNFVNLATLHYCCASIAPSGRERHEAVMQLLLDKEADVVMKVIDRWTAKTCAERGTLYDQS